jgi:hypothetical protein
MRQTALLVLLLAGSSVVNVLQWQKTERLNKTFAQAEAISPLLPGDLVPAMSGVTNSGTTLEIVSDRMPRDRVIYWISARCKWSTLNERSFRRLYDLKHNEFDFVAVSALPEALTEAQSLWTPPYRLVGPPPTELQQQARLQETPSTVVVGPDRKLLRVWKGAYIGKIKSEVERFFHITLPTLQ